MKVQEKLQKLKDIEADVSLREKGVYKGGDIIGVASCRVGTLRMLILLGFPNGHSSFYYSLGQHEIFNLGDWGLSVQGLQS